MAPNDPNPAIDPQAILSNNVIVDVPVFDEPFMFPQFTPFDLTLHVNNNRVDPTVENVPLTVVYVSVLLFVKPTVPDSVTLPAVLLIVKLFPSVPAPDQVDVPEPRIVISVEPLNDLVTVKFPFIDKVLPLRATALGCALEEVNEPVTVKGSFRVIVVATFIALAMITEVGQAIPFDVILAVFAVILKSDDPVNVIPEVIVRVPLLIPS
jgi:hypothetical protein